MVSVQNDSTASTNTTSAIADKTYDYAVEKLGPITDFDSFLKKIQAKGYLMYFNSRYTNMECVDRIAAGKGINCTDSAQLAYKVAIALGYEVQFIHVRCSSGTGHIRLRLKHKTNTGGNWIYRDPASVLKGGAITSNWCESGKVIAYDPSWIFTDL